MSCSTSRMARPEAASSRSSSENSSVSDSLRPDDGSSSSRTRGLVASARAISTSRCVPVDRRSTRSLRDRREPDALDELVGERAGLELLARPALAHLRRDEDVVAHAERAERLEPLERAADAEPRALVRLRGGDVLAVEHHGAAGGWLQSRDHVEERGLPRAVGTDQTGHFVLGHVDGDGGKSLETTETHRDGVDVEERHGARTYPKSCSGSSGHGEVPVGPSSAQPPNSTATQIRPSALYAMPTPAARVGAVQDVLAVTRRCHPGRFHLPRRHAAGAARGCSRRRC